MKYLKLYQSEVSRYLFFQAPTEGNFGPPEWHDPERAKERALNNLRDAKNIGI